METMTTKKVTLDRAALLAMLTKVASNPVILAHLTGRPHEIFKEYGLLTTKEESCFVNSCISTF